MIRRIVSIIALSGLVALDVNAQPGPGNPPGNPAAGPGAAGPGAASPGKGPATKSAPAPGPGAPGVGKGPKGPPDGVPGKSAKAEGPGGKSAPGDEADDKSKPGSAEREAQFAKRVEKLKARAEELRKQGKIKAAEGLQKQAERLEQRGVNGPDPAKSAANREKIRKARKLARVKLLHRRYGEELNTEVVRQEVELHARRSANLSRIKSLASSHEDGEKKQELLKRINRLMAKENARHSRTMAKLAKPKKAPATMVDSKKSSSGGGPTEGKDKEGQK